MNHIVATIPIHYLSLQKEVQVHVGIDNQYFFTPFGHPAVAPQSRFEAPFSEKHCFLLSAFTTRTSVSTDIIVLLIVVALLRPIIRLTIVSF